ncbi:MAG: nucleotidyltransferase domain-containing protein [Candidatus Wallbacteria bacterium]|nr:nucleotidyltransferase domain-containing protein [Candidatus Wallbacteria bacterium]
MARRPDPETHAELKDFLDALGRRFKPLRAVLFGSRARGTHLRSSDFDLLLISEAFVGVPFRDRIKDASLDWDGEWRLDVLCYSPEELERKRAQIGVVAEALVHGIELEVPSQ